MSLLQAFSGCSEQGLFFILRTAFAASHRLWVIVFSLSFVSMYFLISSLISSVISCLFSSALFSLHVFFFYSFFPAIDFQSHSVVLRKDAWYDLNFLKLSEAWFVHLDLTQDAIYPGECSMCTWQESVFCHFWMECCINIKSIYSIVSFKACVSLFIFCLGDLSVGVSGVLKSPI